MLLGSYRLLMVAAVSYVLCWTYNELPLMMKVCYALFLGMSIGTSNRFSLCIIIFLWKNLVVVGSMGKPLNISDRKHDVQMPMKTVDLV